MRRQSGITGQAVMGHIDARKHTAAHPVQRKTNTTGIPDQLKAGIEGLSGLSMDDVHVHYNSSKPTQFKAQAYAQGTDIHISPGQEQHLPHEAWHVVQQKQGRVAPTMQIKGASINADAGLEREADIMGARALHTGAKAGRSPTTAATSSSTTVQRKIKYQDHEVSDLGDALELLQRKDNEYGRSINFREYEDGVAQIMRSDEVFELLDADNDPARHALSYIIRQLNTDRGVAPGRYYESRSFEEMMGIMASDSDLNLQRLNTDTYTYRWGGTSALENALTGEKYKHLHEDRDFPKIVLNHLNKVVDPESNLRRISLVGSPIVFVERAKDNSGPQVEIKLEGELLAAAQRLMGETDLLTSSAWTSARTQAEQIGAVGEYLAQFEMGTMMPHPDAGEGERIHHLANIHFMGDVYETAEAPEPKRQDTDAGPELDLMVLKISDSAPPQCLSIGNVKVGRNNLASDAAAQNVSARTLIEAYNSGTRTQLGKHWVVVKAVHALDIHDGRPMNIPKPIVAGGMGEHTIGPNNGGEGYTNQLRFTFSEVKQIALYLEAQR
ncbi:MAG: DUF4157 domain-containing protein [Myxococcota bacterium]